MDPSNTLCDLSKLMGHGIARNQMRAERSETHLKDMYRKEAEYWEKAFDLFIRLIKEQYERQDDN